jgi:NAD(P)H dehydrogenase (quinone)
MKVLVIIGHQKKGSFCHAIAETAIRQLETAGHEVVYHDLYEEGFDPVLRHEEISGEVELDPVVAKHCREVLDADGYVVVHPNWWGQPPAMLKGWVDRVIRQDVMYEFTAEGVLGKLQGKTALVLTTSNTPRDVELAVFGDPLENLWKTCTFNFCGVENFQRRNFESIVMSTPEQRKGWLAEVAELAEQRFPADG